MLRPVEIQILSTQLQRIRLSAVSWLIRRDFEVGLSCGCRFGDLQAI
jgi:hypothetical protein